MSSEMGDDTKPLSDGVDRATPAEDKTLLANAGRPMAKQIQQEKTQEPTQNKGAVNGQPKAEVPVFAVPQSKPMMPPPGFKPPVPKFNSGPPPSAAKTDQQKDEAFARSLAISAGAKAARNVAPGQMERAISEAAAAAASAYVMTKSMGKKQPAGNQDNPQQERGPAGPVPAYKEPSWGAAPQRAEFYLEVMKGGQIIGKEELKDKSHFTVGRIPTCDLVQQHPSISRVHAVLQFQGDSAPPKLYAMGSHGTFVNKKQVQTEQYTPLRVGDILKFGLSTRMFILGGPTEMMPEEGLSRAQRHQLAALEAQEKRKEREKQVAKAQMAAALNKGISWGMGEDAAEDDESAQAPSVDWRAYSSTHSLTDKQQKLADKIKRLENRIRNLTTESEKIRAKQTRMEELTSGQAQTLARNEQVIDSSTDDLEDLEEQLTESIAESLRGKKNKLNAEQLKAGKRKRLLVEEKEESESGEDDFYDRTAPSKSKKQRSEKIHAQDPSAIFGRKAALLEEASKLRNEIKEEESSESSEAKTQEPASLDPLDAFMSNVATQIEHSKVEKMRKQLTELEGEIGKLEVSLAQADPDGYFKEGTRAARLAKEKGIRQYNQDRDRKIALEKKKRQEAAEKAAQEAENQVFVPEEEDDVLDIPTDPIGTTSSSIATNVPPQSTAAPLPAAEPQPEAPPSGTDSQVTRDGNGAKVAEPTVQPPTASLVESSSPAEGPQSLPEPERPTFGLQIMKKKPVAKKPVAYAPSQNASPASQPQQEADPMLDDVMEEEGGEENQNSGAKFVWKPPSNQTGDGRTALNDKYGY